MGPASWGEAQGKLAGNTGWRCLRSVTPPVLPEPGLHGIWGGWELANLCFDVASAPGARGLGSFLSCQELCPGHPQMLLKMTEPEVGGLEILITHGS